MVDWKSLFESWDQVSPELQKKIFDALLAKSQDSLAHLFMAEPYAKAIWNKIPESQRFPQQVKPTVAPAAVLPTLKPSLPGRAAAAPPRPTMILGDDEKKLLLSYFVNRFVREMGRTIPRVNDVFNVEFQSVKTLSFEEAKNKVLDAADEIISEMRAREVVRTGEKISSGRGPSILRGVPTTGRQPSKIEEETGGGEEEEGFSIPARARIPETSFPDNPIEHGALMPFPRMPNSDEKKRLWNVFCYQLQQQGFDCMVFDREFHAYIENSTFLSWDDVKEKFEFFTKTVMSGEMLPPIVLWRGKFTIPTSMKGMYQELKPPPKRPGFPEIPPFEYENALIVHWASSQLARENYYRDKVYTLDDLYDELVRRGVLPSVGGEKEEQRRGEFYVQAKAAIRAAFEKKDIKFLGVSIEQIDHYLSSA